MSNVSETLGGDVCYLENSYHNRGEDKFTIKF